MDIQRIGVIGCGLMGAGIAQCAAEAGLLVRIREADAALLAKGLARIESAWARGLAKGRLTEDQLQTWQANLTAPSLSPTWAIAIWWWRPSPNGSISSCRPSWNSTGC